MRHSSGVGAKTWMLVYADGNARDALLRRVLRRRGGGYPFPFHPLDLGEAALAALFGYHIEGPIDPALLAPETIPLARYKRSRSRWKFW